MDSVKRIIAGYRRRMNFVRMARAILQSLMIFVLGLHLFYLLHKNLDSSSQILFYSNLAIRSLLVLVLIYVLFRASQKLLSSLLTARYLDSCTDHCDDLLQNTLELEDKGTSTEIVNALAQQATERLETNKYKLPAFLSTKLSLLYITYFVCIGAIWSLDYADFSSSLHQFYTNRVESLVYKDTIEVKPGSVRLARNSQLLVEVVNPERRLEHRLFYRTESSWRELAMTDYSYLFERLENNLEYYVENNAAKSPVFKVEVVDEPIVRAWQLSYSYPSYMGLNPVTDSLSYGNITAYAGTRVKLAIRSNVPLVSATLRYSDGKSVDLSALDSQNWLTQLTVSSNQTWYMELKDELGRTSRPEEKQITVVPDNPPQVRILFPGRDITLEQDLLLPLIISGDDDFGLQDCNLKYQINDGAIQTKSIQTVISGKLFNRDYVFEMRPLNLIPGNVVSYWVEIFDNSPAHQKAESAVFRARYPSMEEIFREIERRERSNAEDLEQIADRTGQLREDFEELRREMMNQDNPEWRQQQELQQIMREQDTLMQQVEDVNQNFQNLIERMESNTNLSSDMLQKMQRIQELMEEINSEGLQQALEQMQEAMENISMDELRRAMENFRFSLDDFEQKLEQTLDLLESVRLEQAMQKALQISEEMERMQENLNQRTSDQSQDNQRLASDQESISQKYENLQQELQNLQNMMDPQKDKEARQSLEQMRQDMQNSQLSSDLNQSQQKLSENNRSAASQSQEEALRKMRQFTRRLQQMKESMASGSQQGIMQAMEAAIRELLVFSRSHEATAARYQNDPYSIVGDLISNYEGIQLSLNKLYSNPMVMMFLPPKFFIDLTATNTAYREFFIGISEMQYARVPELLVSIQRGINLMIYDLMQAMQNSSSGSGGGGGMQSLMQMLGQMGQEQLAMNMLTQQLLQQMQSQGMSPAMQQQLQRLASEEQRLADNLKRALQNNPQAQRQGNAIQQIIEEAETISRQLRAGQLNQDLLNRQERIISRMLDAQRSLNQREQSRERRAEASERQNWESQGVPVDFETLRRRAILDETYRSYPREYQELIIEYLKRINGGSQ